MSADEIRQTLEKHLGGEKYARFLENFAGIARRRGRLLHWQKRALEGAGLPLNFEQCLPIFALCHIHRLPLYPFRVPDFDGDYYFSKEFEAAMASFPYSASVASYAKDLILDHCPECVRQREIYEAALRKRMDIPNDVGPLGVFRSMPTSAPRDQTAP